jgi:hypothetical protein
MRTLVALIGSLAVVAAGCGGGTGKREFELRIYDPTGKVPVELTAADIVRGSVRAELPELQPVGGGYAVVSIALTDTGTSKLCRLTRALARRGRQLGKRQITVIEINGRVRSRVRIDHDASPKGICGAPGFEIQGIRRKEAQALVRLIRE